jgi:hypothetical protein
VQQEYLAAAGRTINGLANGIPVVGHAKGAIHYMCGDKEGGNQAMNAATRSIVVGGGGIVGFCTAGPAGTALAGAAAGMGYDTMVTTITGEP